MKQNLFFDAYATSLTNTGPALKAEGMAVPVMRWIGERIQQVDQI